VENAIKNFAFHLNLDLDLFTNINLTIMKNLAIVFYAWLIDSLRKIAMLSNSTMKLLFLPGFEKFRFFNGRLKMQAEYIKAVHTVPAYAALAKEQIDDNIIPETSKDCFVKQYAIADRCVDGQIPNKGVVIDESSGSSGTPTNWVRGEQERKTNMRFIEFAISQIFDDSPKTIINAFAMGSWATGVNVSMASVAFAKVKSTGPDCAKIQETIAQFGKDETYIIMGYPPFLKYFVDTTELDLNEYKIDMIMGGEAMSEGLRSYLKQKGIQKIISSYGASDLELNICAENDFTIGLRQLLIANDYLKKDLLIDDNK